MTPESIQQSLNLKECKDLPAATEKIWLWIRENLDNFEDAEKHSIMDQLTDLFGDHHPDRCPNLDSEWKAAIDAGISRANEQVEADITELDNYTPSPWMSQAMQDADRTLGKERTDQE